MGIYIPEKIAIGANKELVEVLLGRLRDGNPEVHLHADVGNRRDHAGRHAREERGDRSPVEALQLDGRRRLGSIVRHNGLVGDLGLLVKVPNAENTRRGDVGVEAREGSEISSAAGRAGEVYLTSNEPGLRLVRHVHFLPVSTEAENVRDIQEGRGDLLGERLDDSESVGRVVQTLDGTVCVVPEGVVQSVPRTDLQDRLVALHQLDDVGRLDTRDEVSRHIRRRAHVQRSRVGRRRSAAGRYEKRLLNSGRHTRLLHGRRRRGDLSSRQRVHRRVEVAEQLCSVLAGSVRVEDGVGVRNLKRLRRDNGQNIHVRASKLRQVRTRLEARGRTLRHRVRVVARLSVGLVRKGEHRRGVKRYLDRHDRTLVGPQRRSAVRCGRARLLRRLVSDVNAVGNKGSRKNLPAKLDPCGSRRCSLALHGTRGARNRTLIVLRLSRHRNWRRKINSPRALLPVIRKDLPQRKRGDLLALQHRRRAMRAALQRLNGRVKWVSRHLFRL